MKRLAMVLAVAFTMGLAASSVSASTKDEKKTEKKECCAKAKECSKEAKAECAKEKKAETSTEKK
ncbi:MAG: hypothetical protein Q8S54_13935 [Bacteroidota bacterium]|nr:hypothetical protein [Bacteroidota bacterium]